MTTHDGDEDDEGSSSSELVVQQWEKSLEVLYTFLIKCKSQRRRASRHENFSTETDWMRRQMSYGTSCRDVRGTVMMRYMQLFG